MAMANRRSFRGRPALVGAGVVLGFTLLGCAPQVSTHGYRLDEAALAQVEPGRTSQDQVLQLLGSPSSLSTFGDPVWYYVTQRTERMSFYQTEVVGQDVITIAFDDLGIVNGIERVGLEQAQEVALVDRETPTAGSELNMFEQFVGNIGRFNPPADGDK